MFGSPVVQIIAPTSSSKVYSDRPMTVRFRVEADEGSTAVRNWILEVVDASGNRETIASGTNAELSGRAVIELRDETTIQAPIAVLLSAVDEAGGESRAEIAIRLSSPTYRLIPMREGNHSVLYHEVLSTDALGRRISLGGEFDSQVNVTEALLHERVTGARKAFRAEIGSNIHARLSPDGFRFFYTGLFREEPGVVQLGLGFSDLAGDKTHLVAQEGQYFFSVSQDGRYVAYQKEVREEGGARLRQYFWQDTATGEERQLTNSPDAVVLSDKDDICPRVSGTVPHISGDGQRVVIVTGSTLASVAAKPTVGCRVFSYDIPTDVWKLAAELPLEIALGNSVLSADGRWLSFTSSRPVAGGRQAFPALLDLATGELTDPVAGLAQFAALDSAITYDGHSIILSTTADLDPRVGNEDHNLELFIYDRETGEFDQVSETTGGIGLTSGRCDSIEPGSSADAEVVTFGFNVLSVERCRLEGAQRNEVDGFEFRSVRAVRKREGNRGPEWQPPLRAFVRAGESLEVDFTAVDPDGDPLTFFAQQRPGRDVPRGSEMNDWHDGTATFTWPTRPEDTGRYTLRVAVFDEGGGEDWVDLPIAICSRTADDGNLAGILWALFGADSTAVPVECRGADLNADGRITAADLLAAVGWKGN